ncbi:MAG: serine hydrolase domain-containing protein [Kofleriaceae bacterium]
MRSTLVVLAIAGCGSSHVPPTPNHADLVTKIDELAATTLAKTPVAGFSIAVVWHGKTVLAKGYGLADVAHHTVADADTIYRIGSITKQFTALAILQLAAARRLGIDDELSTLLPDYPLQGKRVTIRQLLTHTSGIHDYETGVPWFREHQAEARPGAELVAQFAAAPFDFEPGTRWSYSNSGYYLLGQIIEKRSKQTYADYLRDHVAADGISYCPDDQRGPHAAQGYAADGKTAAPPIKMVYAYAAGALCATAPALAAWAGRLRRDPRWAQMIVPATLADGSHPAYGFGLFVDTLGGHRVVFHGGGINGFVSTLASYPDDDLDIAVLVNTESSVADVLGDNIARIVLGIPKMLASEHPVDSARAAAIVGSYTLSIGVTFTIENAGGQLFLRQGDERRALIEQADGSFAIAEADGTLILSGGALRLRFELAGGHATKIIATQAGLTFEGVPAK